MSVIGVPKTIDNDILLMDKTFGFDTAVEEAQRAINSAYIEVNYYLFSVTLTQCSNSFCSVHVKVLTFFLSSYIRHIVHIMESGL